MKPPFSLFSRMAASISPISTKALKLPPKDRMGLAALLLESLDENSGVDSKLLRTLTKRAAELRSGKVKGLTTEQAYGFSL
jgi:hypothetical protein